MHAAVVTIGTDTSWRILGVVPPDVSVPHPTKAFAIYTFLQNKDVFGKGKFIFFIFFFIFVNLRRITSF